MYSASEFEVICSDLEHAARLGVAGVVCGILHEDNTVDEARTSKLAKLAGPMEVTFHRAFDQTPNLARALEQVIACGCHRVLTSGGGPSAGESESMLVALVEQARERVRIAAGGGITTAIAASLLARTHLDLHASLRRRLVVDAKEDPNPVVGSEPAFELQVWDVRAMVQVIESME